ncbi:MAG: malate synthase G, partial [Gammaproteobacteria bacterium]
RGDLKSTFTKNGEQVEREISTDFSYSGKDDCEYKVKGKSLLLVRNVGHLMTTSLMLNDCGDECFEGIIDSIITATIASLDISDARNSQRGSIYIIKPKMHGPEEVAFTCELFARIEKLLGLPEHTIKLGIMDEERRTTVNLKACIRVAKERVFFINTGFLDRTGDEIHTCMEAGPVLPKDEIKQQPWIAAYEQNNVDIGLQTGFRGRAQIGKGMWAMPDEMAQMITDKLAHPLAGADTAWVPSPTAATLHALHYHAVNVDAVQAKLMNRKPANLDDIHTAPLLNRALTEQEVEHELANNIQGILGYMVRWIDLGIGCSKVPDINNVGLMEDRATLRISSQHISNWLKHGICTPAQVDQQMQRMAQVVDQQNINTPGYQPMAVNFETNTAFQAARTLIYEGCDQPSGYTEPVLHQHRLAMK